MGYNWHQSNMRTHLFILSTLVLFAFCSCSKSAGDPVTAEFSIENSYTGLSVENGFDITVSDAVNQLTITAGENVMPNVLVEKVGSKLRIRLRSLSNSYGSEMKVVLPYNPNLTSVELSGASEFHSDYGLEGENVEVNLSGASEFNCDIEADEIEIDLSGASSFFGDIDADVIDMELSGASNVEGLVAANELDLDMSGASDATFTGQVVRLKIGLTGASNIKKTINGTRYGFECDKCEGEMSGGSDAYIHCDGSIKVSLSGGSELHYTGNAATTGSSTSGGSNISHDVL